MRIENNTIYFYGSSEPFSNWYKCDFKIGNVTFNCSEQALMYSKALLSFFTFLNSFRNMGARVLPITFVKPPLDAISIIPDQSISIPAIVSSNSMLSSAPDITPCVSCEPFCVINPQTTATIIKTPNIMFKLSNPVEKILIIKNIVKCWLFCQ